MTTLMFMSIWNSNPNCHEMAIQFAIRSFLCKYHKIIVFADFCSSNLTNVGASANRGLAPTSIRTRIGFCLNLFPQNVSLFAWISPILNQYANIVRQMISKMISYIGHYPITCFSSDRKVYHDALCFKRRHL